MLAMLAALLWAAAGCGGAEPPVEATGWIAGDGSAMLRDREAGTLLTVSCAAGAWRVAVAAPVELRSGRVHFRVDEGPITTEDWAWRGATAVRSGDALPVVRALAAGRTAWMELEPAGDEAVLTARFDVAGLDAHVERIERGCAGAA